MFKLFVLIILSVLIVFSCDDNAVEPSGEQTLTYQYADYVFVDTSVYYLLKHLETGDNCAPEPVMNWEQSLGEPFTDVNGNGVYDIGIDGFIMSGDATNMDLDHNSRYTGPDETWQAPIPFDDINGDSEYRMRDYTTQYYPLCPFMDLNGNGQYDNVMNYNYNVIKFDDSGLLVDYDSVFTFVSDSNVTYLLNSYYGSFNRRENAQLVYNDSGLIFYINQTASYDLYRIPLSVIDTGKITASVTESLLVNIGVSDDSLYYRKSVSLGETLGLDGQQFTNLLEVNFDNPVVLRNGISDTRFDGSYYKFYFSKTLGLLVMQYKLNEESSDVLMRFNERVDNIPIMMIQ